jgi:hypothetical protein
MLRELIGQVEELRRSRIRRISIRAKDGHTVIDGPAAGQAGIYFFYTSYTPVELGLGGIAPTSKAVPVASFADIKAQQHAAADVSASAASPLWQRCG